MCKVALVRLTPEQRAELTERLEREALNGRRRRHFQILLLSDAGHTDEQIAAATGANRSTVKRTRKRCAREGMEAALQDKPRSGAPAKLDGKQEAMIVALACSDAPGGRNRWTAKLLANRVVELGVVESLSESTVRRVLKKRAEALAEAVLVHPQGQRRVRGPDGGRAGVVRRAARRGAAGGPYG